MVITLSYNPERVERPALCATCVSGMLSFNLSSIFLSVDSKIMGRRFAVVLFLYLVLEEEREFYL